MTEEYEHLCRELAALSEGVEDSITLLSNAAALLFMRMPNINWAGFYRLFGTTLRLGPFQGKPACTRIAWGRGVCGTAVKENRIQRVEDVHLFPGHIACDSVSRSEIVLPLHVKGKTVGVLDIDSPAPGRFSEEDQAGLENFVSCLVRFLETSYAEENL